MKTRSLHHPFSPVAKSFAAVLLFCHSADAQNTTNTFNGGVTSLTTVGNWSLGHLPTVTEDAVISSGTADIKSLTTGDLTVGSWNLTAGFGTWSIRNNTSGATDSSITLGGVGNLGNGVTGAVAADLLFVRSGGTFNIVGPNGSTGTGVLKLILGQSGNFNIAGTSTISAVISGNTFGFTKTGTGTLNLTAANTYTGATKINGGPLNLSGSISSSSALELGGGTLTYAPTVVGSTQTFNGTTVNAGGGTITNLTSGNTVALGALTRNIGGVLNVSSLVGTTTTSTGVDSTGILGTWATTGTGTGLRYSAGGSGSAITGYGGGTAAATAAGVTDTTAAVNYDVAAIGTLGAGASFNTLRYTGAAGTIAGNFTANGLMNAGSGTATYSGSVTIGINKELVITGNTQNTTISGAIANNGGGISGLTYGGAGKLTLSGGHTFTGAINVNTGTVDLWDTANAYTNNISLATSATLDAANTGTNTTITISGDITGAGKINKTSSSSSLVLNGNNTFSGGVTLTDGTLVAGNGTNNGIGTGPLTLSSGTFRASDNAARTFSNAISMGSNPLTFGAAQAAVTGQGDLNFTSTGSVSVGGSKTWTVNNATTVTFANNWNGNNGWNVTKAGTGTLVFNGGITTTNSIGVVVSAGTLALNGTTNSYTGATTVNGGRLLVNGSITSSAVTVNTGGALGGTGTVGGATTITNGGKYSAGAVGAVGNQSFSQNLTLDSGSIFEWDLATASTASGFDTVTGAAGKTFSAAADFRVVTDLDFSADTFWDTQRQWSSIFNSFGTATGWSFLTAASVYSTAGVLRSDVSTHGSFTITGTTLTWSAVPEPTSAIAGLLLGAGLLRRRRA